MVPLQSERPDTIPSTLMESQTPGRPLKKLRQTENILILCEENKTNFVYLYGEDFYRIYYVTRHRLYILPRNIN